MNKDITKMVLLVFISQVLSFVAFFVFGKTDEIITVLIMCLAIILFCLAIFIAGKLLPKKLWFIKYWLWIVAIISIMVGVIMVIATATGQHIVKDDGIYFSW